MAIDVKIGTRASPLALAQAHEVKTRLQKATSWDEARFKIIPMQTKGDQITDRPLSAIGGKGLFTQEIEAGLLSGALDIAVHSMKDMPTVLPDGLCIPCILEREDPRDAFISSRYKSLYELPKGARFGTSSIRRHAQILTLRPDLQVVAFRGNVQTRLQKLADGVADATLLAAAGVHRLGQHAIISGYMDTDDMLPAPAQGAIGVETRTDNVKMHALLEQINHRPTQRCINAERAFLARLDGSCATPIAAFARIKGDDLHLSGQLLNPDTHQNVRLDIIGTAPQDIGTKLGDQVLKQIKTL